MLPLPNPSNEEISQALARVAELLEFGAGHRGRIEAHRHAAAVIRGCARPISALVSEDGVEGLHQLGLGYRLSGLLVDWLRTGDFPLLRRLEERRQPVRALGELPGIGPRLACEVHHSLGVGNLEQLEEAARDGRLGQVCGFGPRRVALVRGVLDSMLHRRGCRSRPARPIQLELEISLDS